MRQKGARVWRNGTMIWPLKVRFGSDGSLTPQAPSQAPHGGVLLRQGLERVPQGQGGSGGAAGLPAVEAPRGDVARDEGLRLVAVGALLEGRNLRQRPVDRLQRIAVLGGRRQVAVVGHVLPGPFDEAVEPPPLNLVELLQRAVDRALPFVQRLRGSVG